jgi:hypothetical protein
MSGFVSADQLLAHAVGDYILQSHWMATEKTKWSVAAACHALAYGLPFCLFGPSVAAMAVIVGSHFAIDRYRLARYVVWAKNWIAPHANRPWAECAATGYAPDVPPWLSVWLLIVADNVLHVTINAAALRWL